MYVLPLTNINKTLHKQHAIMIWTNSFFMCANFCDMYETGVQENGWETFFKKIKI